MEIKRLIVDKKPTDCIVCPLSKLRICGEPYNLHTSSGATKQGMKPDVRCLAKEGKK